MLTYSECCAKNVKKNMFAIILEIATLFISMMLSLSISYKMKRTA